MKVCCALVLAIALLGGAQDGSTGHNSGDPKKCKKCSAAYDKAVAYARASASKAYLPAKMFIGLLLLYDGRFPEDVDQIVKTALSWDGLRKGIQHGQNWFPALAGLFLAEVYRWKPTDEVKDAINKIVDEFGKTQEKTGGWWKWFEGAYKDMPAYPVKDLGMLTSVIYGFLVNIKSMGFKIPAGMLERADKCIHACLSGMGISYGTGSSMEDTTGARGGFALLGLDYAHMTNDKIYSTYVKLLPTVIPKMDKGHHIGGLHCAGVTLACHRLGPAVYRKLTSQWLDKLIDKQDAQGGVYVGDDGDAGGEKGLFGENYASTAAFAMMILGQDPKAFAPPPPPKKK